MNEIIEMIADFKGIDESDVKPDSNFVTELGFTSFQITSFIAEIEEKYDVDIPTNQLRSLTTPQDVYDYITANS